MSLKNIILNIFRNIRLSLLKCIDFFVPKNKNLLLFGSRAGRQYGDNTRFLFEWVRKNKPEINAYYLTFDKEVLESKDKDENIINYNSSTALRKLMRAKKIFISHGFGDMPYQSLCKKRRDIYYLGHGISFKRTDLAVKTITKRKIRKFRRKTNKLQAFISSGLERLALHAYFGIPYSQIMVTGTPRNEMLWENIKKDKGLHHKLNAFYSLKEKINKAILYAPTYLPDKKNNFFSFKDFDLKKLNDFLLKNDIHLFLRMHRNDLRRFGKSDEDFLGDRILLADFDMMPDINAVLHEFDILITDFSSIFFDYFLVNKPIIYITSTLEEFNKETGFYFNFENVTPGPKVNNFSEFMDALKESINDPEKWKEKRLLLTNLFHEYTRGKSCKMIMEYILDK